MNIALWVAQGLLAALFFMAGLVKLTTTPESKPALEEKMAWAKGFSLSTIKLIGGVELLGAIGLILPQLTGILPTLTPLAAAGLVMTMLVAMVVEFRTGDYSKIGLDAVVGSLAVFIAYGRFAY